MKIVDKCYADFLSNVQDKLSKDREYKKAKSECRQALIQIESTLTPEQLRLLRKYDDSVVNVNSVIARKHYMYGFNYGRKFK